MPSKVSRRLNQNEENGSSRRKFLVTGAGAAALMGAGATSLPAQDSGPGDPDLTLHLMNGSIHTMDAGGRVASRVTIRNGRFVSVDGPALAAGPGVRVIDLGGRTVVPGLVEPHIHSVRLANRPGYHTILETTTSIREVQEVLAQRRKDAAEGAWITSMGGWHTNQWAEHRHPTLAELDEAVPDRPVLLYERFTGPCVTNSLGKAFFAAAPPVHPDVKPVSVSATGAIAGSGPSTTALFYLRRMQTFEDRKRSTMDAMNYSASVGLTAHLDQVLYPTPGPLNPNRFYQISTSTECTTRGLRFIERAKRSFACR